MTSFSESERALLQRVLCGELPYESQEVQAALSRNPRLSRELSELREAESELVDAARDGESLLATARIGVDEVARSEVRRALGPFVDDGAPRGLPRWRRGAWLAAAAILLVLGIAFLARDRGERTDGLLGGEPVLEVRAVAESWSFGLGRAPNGGEFRVRVYAVSGDEAGELLLEARATRETWELPPDLARRARGGESFQVLIQARDGMLQPVGVARSAHVPPR